MYFIQPSKYASTALLHRINKSSGSMYPFALTVVLLLISTVSGAQDKTSEIDKIFSWASTSTPGCVCAVSKDGKVIVNRAYGLADLERHVPMSTASVFDVASIRKQFIAAAILLLAEEKRISLTDDVRKYYPELHDYGHTITIDHLLTHTSGLRDWTGLLPLAGGQADVFTLIKRQRGLNFAPGEEWSYSNTGYVLLKEIVQRISGLSFAAFTRTRLFEPLGMKATAYHEDLKDIINHRALAYEKKGSSWKLDMLIDNERGGGGALFSSAGDLLIWNEAIAGNKLGKMVSEKLQEPATLNNGRKLIYTRGLIIDDYRGMKLMAHSGGAAGYHSWSGQFPQQGLSIAVTCNSDAMPATAIGRRIADLFLPSTVAQGEKNHSGTAEKQVADGVDISSRAGLFFNESGDEWVRLGNNNSGLQIVGGPALVMVDKDRLRNTRGDLFFRSQDEFEIKFNSPDQFEMKSMEGKVVQFRRAQSYTPTAAALQAFAGKYHNDEISSTFQVVPSGEGLIMRFALSPEKSLALKAVAPDVFQIARVTVRFLRDKNGQVVSFHYSNPVIRNMEFTKSNK